MAIATLPMLNGKVYAIWSPSLVQAAMRNKNMTFDVFGIEFAQRVMGITDEAAAIIKGPGGVEESLAPETMAAIKVAMTGQNLYRMNVSALTFIATRLNTFGPTVDVPNLYRWLRELMTMATAEALYGPSNNPLREDPSLIDALWTFDSNLRPLFLGIWPTVVARTAYRARTKVQNVLRRFYDAHLDEDPDAAEITRVRARVVRKHGISGYDLAQLEVALLFVATTNTIPTLYWLFSNVWLRPTLVEEVRAEVAPLVELSAAGEDSGERLATLNIAVLEEKCPLLVSCYREAIRLGNQALGTRRVLKDTTITDDDGTSYLLKEGVDVMWSARALHRSESTWGGDADAFNSSRFMPAKEADANDRRRRQSYVPFGGGKHLCPGRNFAFAENLAFMSAFVLGFDVTGLKDDNVKMDAAALGEAVVKPAADGEGGSVTFRRRKGWEDVQWRFVC